MGIVYRCKEKRLMVDYALAFFWSGAGTVMFMFAYVIWKERKK